MNAYPYSVDSVGIETVTVAAEGLGERDGRPGGCPGAADVSQWLAGAVPLAAGRAVARP